MNIIAELWRNSLLAAHYNEDAGDNDADPTDFVKDYLKDIDNHGIFVPLQNDMDYGFIWATHRRVEICFRGTVGKGWFSNAKFWPNKEGVETGFAEGFAPFEKPIVDFVKNNRWKPIFISGHSRGGPFAVQGSNRIKELSGIYSKCLTYCGPVLSNAMYNRRLKKNRIDVLRIINPGDVVDNVGVGIFAGRHYGKKIELPKAGKYHRIWSRLPVIRRFFGHAYSSVTEGLIQYFYGRGMTAEAEYLKTLKWIAKI